MFNGTEKAPKCTVQCCLECSTKKIKPKPFALHYVQCDIQRIFTDQLEITEWQTFYLAFLHSLDLACKDTLSFSFFSLYQLQVLWYGESIWRMKYIKKKHCYKAARKHHCTQRSYLFFKGGSKFLNNTNKSVILKNLYSGKSHRLVSLPYLAHTLVSHILLLHL